MLLKKFSDFVIKYKLIIIAVFAVLLALCIVGTIFLVKDENKINSDMMSYLAEDYSTTKGLNYLKKNFGVRGDAMVVVRGVENDSALKNSVEKIKNKYPETISQFIWIDDIASLSKLQSQLAAIDKEDFDFLEEENMQRLLKDEDIGELLPLFKYFADLPGALDMSVQTEELNAYLK